MTQNFYLGKEFPNGANEGNNRVHEPVHKDYEWRVMYYTNYDEAGHRCENVALREGTQYYVHRTTHLDEEGRKHVVLAAGLQQPYIKNSWYTMVTMEGMKGKIMRRQVVDFLSWDCLKLVFDLAHLLFADYWVIQGGGMKRQIEHGPHRFDRYSEHLRHLAVDQCTTLTEVDATSSTPGVGPGLGGLGPGVGLQYLLGAANAGYHMVFFHKEQLDITNPPQIISHVQVVDLQRMLGEDLPDLLNGQFISETYGDTWVFCYCKRYAVGPRMGEALRSCLDMDFYEEFR